MSGPAVFPYPREKAEDVLVLAARTGRLARRIDHGAAELAREGAALATGWAGAAASAGFAEIGHIARLVGALALPMARAGALLTGYHDAIMRARGQIDRLRWAHDEAAEALLTAATRAGLATPSLLAAPSLRALETAGARVQSGAGALGAHQRAYDAVLGELSTEALRIGRALAYLAGEVECPAGRRAVRPTGSLSGLLGTLPLLRDQRRALAPGRAGIPPTGSPAQLVHAWWALLTGAERERLVRFGPGRLGRLAGLPAAVRSPVNERVLLRLVERLESLEEPDAEQLRWLESCRVVRYQLDAARRRVDPVTQRPQVVQLVAFQPRAFGGDGRAAVSLGDLDTADDVAFLVPGLDADVRDSLPHLVLDASEVGARSRAVEGGQATAVVAWMGYDAPTAAQLWSRGPAQVGGDLLARDLLAVQASRAVLPHLTVIGHSYGSTVAGAALRDHRTGAGDVILLGSPGAAVRRARDLAVPPGHVFAGASSRDPVSYLEAFGPDPAHREFGAVRFAAEDPGRNPWRLDLDDHSRYFAPDTESLANIGRIVAGDRDGVRVSPYRGDVLLLPYGINADPEARRPPIFPARW